MATTTTRLIPLLLTDGIVNMPRVRRAAGLKLLFSIPSHLALLRVRARNFAHYWTWAAPLAAGCLRPFGDRRRRLMEMGMGSLCSVLA